MLKTIAAPSTTTTTEPTFFEAVCVLSKPEQGCLVAKDTGKAAVVAKHLEQQLSHDGPNVRPCRGHSGPTMNPFASKESRTLKNGRAAGTDGIPDDSDGIPDEPLFLWLQRFTF